MATANDIAIRLTAENDQLKAKLRETETLLTGIRNKGEEAGTGLTGAFGKVLGVIGLVSGAVYTFYRMFVKNAMEAEEASSKFATIFKNDSAEVIKWANDLGERIGRSSRSLQYMASDFMALVNPMARSRQEAVQMSMRLTQLVQDIASFHNISVDEAMVRVRSGIAGEAEGLRRLGIDISDTTLKEEARRFGIVKSYESLTMAEKANLRYRVMVERAGEANDDAERTAGSLTNRLRALESAIKSNSTEIGMKFLPNLTKLANTLYDVFKSSEKGFVGNIIGQGVEFVNEFILVVNNLIKSLDYLNQLGSGNTGLMGWLMKLSNFFNPIVQTTEAMRAINSVAGEVMSTPPDGIERYNRKLLEFNEIGRKLLLQYEGDMPRALRNTGDAGVREYKRLKKELDDWRNAHEPLRRAIFNASNIILKTIQDARDNVNRSHQGTAIKPLKQSEIFDLLGMTDSAEIEKIKEKYQESLTRVSRSNMILRNQLNDEMLYQIQQAYAKQRLAREQSLAEYGGDADASERAAEALKYQEQLTRYRDNEEARLQLTQIYAQRREAMELRHNKLLYGIISGVGQVWQNTMSNIDQANRQLLVTMMFGKGGWSEYKDKMKQIFRQLLADITYAIMRAIILQGILAATGMGGGAGVGIGATVGKAFGMFEKGHVPNFQKGFVPVLQSGIPSDHYLAWVGSKEAVMNEETTRANAGLFKYMNDHPGQPITTVGGNTYNIPITGNVLSKDFVDTIVIKRLKELARFEGKDLIGRQRI